MISFPPVTACKPACTLFFALGSPPFTVAICTPVYVAACAAACDTVFKPRLVLDVFNCIVFFTAFDLDGARACSLAFITSVWVVCGIPCKGTLLAETTCVATLACTFVLRGLCDIGGIMDPVWVACTVV